MVIKYRVRNMGKYLTKPITSKEGREGSGQGYRCGVSAMQGWLSSMQDAYIFKPELGHLKTFGLFLVLDGFGGSLLAQKASEDLPGIIINHETFSALVDGKDYDPAKLADALKESLLEFDEKIRNLDAAAECGCTVSGVLITPNHFITLNLGDSRTIIYTDGEIRFNTEDHIPWVYQERMRIEDAGAFIKSGRVNGRLNISRALGNFNLKNISRKRKLEQPLSPEAECKILERKTGKDDFIAIATDGIFRSITNSELVDYLVKRLPYKQHLNDLAADALDYSLYKKTKDNLTLVLIHFDDSTIQAEQEKIRKDKELDAKIQELTRQYVSRAFANGASAYGWEPCFNKLGDLHHDIFSDASNTQGFGIDLKKGVIYAEFDKETSAIRDSRRKEALRRLEESKSACEKQ